MDEALEKVNSELGTRNSELLAGYTPVGYVHLYLRSSLAANRWPNVPLDEITVGTELAAYPRADGARASQPEMLGAVVRVLADWLERHPTPSTELKATERPTGPNILGALNFLILIDEQGAGDDLVWMEITGAVPNISDRDLVMVTLLEVGGAVEGYRLLPDRLAAQLGRRGLPSGRGEG